jgi:hypothetical protein
MNRKLQNRLDLRPIGMKARLVGAVTTTGLCRTAGRAVDVLVMFS